MSIQAVKQARQFLRGGYIQKADELLETIEETKIASGTEAMVCLDIMCRQEKGIKKYGTTVSANPLELKEWLQHAYEECLDQAVYLKRAIEEIDSVFEKGGK